MPVVEELTLEAPLVLDQELAVQVQLTVTEPDAQGRCELHIYSRAQVPGEAEELQAAGWTRHAHGLLCAAVEQEENHADVQAFIAEQWPPPGAEQVDIELVYDRLAGVGYDYGPAFQGLRAAWRRGDELFAEVALDDEQAADAARFQIDLVLCDA